MLEPGSRVSHAAVTLASRVGCLLVWVGDGGAVFPTCVGMNRLWISFEASISLTYRYAASDYRKGHDGTTDLLR
jgi:CRISPR/Cas system-associated endonuclease Cas1